MSGQSSQSAPDYFPGQEKLVGQLIANYLGPQAKGAPNAAQGLAAQRSMEGYYQGAAQRGMDPQSGLAQRGAVDVARGNYAQDEANRFQLINRLMTSPGTTSTGSGGGLCWVADELFGLTDWRTIRARAYCQAHDNWFTRAYREHGQTWAEWVRRYTLVRAVAWPIWRTLAFLGNGVGLKGVA